MSKRKDNFWSWADGFDGQLTQEKLLAAYRLNLKIHKGSCRKNCRTNPTCLSGFGEAAWNQPPEPNFVETLQREPGSYVGLKNLGNTCYLNCLLQLWFHNEHLRTALYYWDALSNDREMDKQLAKYGSFPSCHKDFTPLSCVANLQYLFVQMEFGKEKYCDPEKFCKSLSLNVDQQQDAQEFRNLYMSRLDETFSASSNKITRNVIRDQFQGECVNVTVCQKCKNVSERPPEAFYELGLTIKGCTTILDSLEVFFKEEHLTGDNKYHCSACDSMEDATKHVQIPRLPRVLQFNLERYTYDVTTFRKRKIMQSIQFPDVLDMSAYVKNAKGKLNYSLHALLMHSGTSADSGHYYAHINTQKGWHVFNDTTVKKQKHLKLVTEDALPKQGSKKSVPKLDGFRSSTAAYMLVYKLIEDEIDEVLPHSASLQNGLSRGTAFSENSKSSASPELTIPSTQTSADKMKVEEKTDVPATQELPMSNILIPQFSAVTVQLGMKVDTNDFTRSTTPLAKQSNDCDSVMVNGITCSENSDNLECKYNVRIPNVNSVEKDDVNGNLFTAKNNGSEINGLLDSRENGDENDIRLNAELCKLASKRKSCDIVDEIQLKRGRRRKVVEYSAKRKRPNPDDDSQDATVQTTSSIQSELLGERKSKKADLHFPDVEDQQYETDSRSTKNWEILPPYLKALLERDEAEFEQSCQSQMDEWRRKCDHQKFVEEFMEAIEPDPDEACEFIHYDALRNLCDGPDVPPVNNSPLLCIHGALNFEKFKDYKLISSKAADMYFQRFGGYPKISRADLCSECVTKHALELMMDANLATDVKTVNSLLKAPINEGEMAYWVSKTLLKNWHTLVTKSGEWKIVADDFNSDLLCIHGEMLYEENNRRLVNAACWEIIKKYYTNMPTFDRNVSPCVQCRLDYITTHERKKGQALFEKNALELLHSEKRVNLDLDCSCYLVNSLFISAWRRFTRSIELGTLRDRPSPELAFESLFCEPHNLLIYDPNTDLDRFFLLTEIEWITIKNCYKLDKEIKMEKGPNGVHITSIGICEDCIVNRITQENKECTEESYHGARLYVYKVSNEVDEEQLTTAPQPTEMKKPAVPPPSKKSKKESSLISAPAKKPVIDFVRRSARSRQKDEKLAFTIDKYTTLKELKHMISQRMQVMSSDQHISLNGDDLDELTERLGLTDDQANFMCLGVPPNSVLRLLIDEPSPDLEISDAGSAIPETGFEGATMAFSPVRNCRCSSDFSSYSLLQVMSPSLDSPYLHGHKALLKGLPAGNAGDKFLAEAYYNHKAGANAFRVHHADGTRSLASRVQKAAYAWGQEQGHPPNGVTPKSAGPHHGPHGPPGGPTQGLVHWMSVMAEHMTNASHENPVHYMWNNVDQCGGHGKEMDYWPRPNMVPKQGYEPKMNDQLPHNPHKGGLDEHGVYQGNVRSNPSSNSSSPTLNQGAMLIVPQPINASKMSSSLSAGGRKYNCKMCPQVFGSKADLQLHTQIHMREAKPYKCTQCSKAFANSSYLSQHTRIHLGIKPYRCEICQRKFTQLSHLQQHIRTHTGDKPYRCKFNSCSKAFSQLSNLQSHSRCHQQDKPFKCNSCYKCFVDENSLLEHIPKHRESKHLKTHICPYCGKSYTQETYLTKHMSKHSERTDKRSPILGIGLNRINQPDYWKNESLVEAIANHDRLAISQENLQNLQHFSSLGEHHLAGLNKQTDPRESPDLRSPLSDTVQRSPTLKPNDINKNYEEDILRNNMNEMPSYDIKNNVNTSAFTPITQINYNSRPYIPYDSLSFQNKSIHLDLNKTNGNNCFPNNLISLHQIRNYAHQPTGSIVHEQAVVSLKDK